METIELVLPKNKITKNTVQFQEVSEDLHRISIYLTHERVAVLGNPKSIKIVITKVS
jgi:hypothetical protein